VISSQWWYSDQQEKMEETGEKQASAPSSTQMTHPL
jgi:hypothetical protein